jgi:ankyrin repeat protein
MSTALPSPTQETAPIRRVAARGSAVGKILSTLAPLLLLGGGIVWLSLPTNSAVDVALLAAAQKGNPSQMVDSITHGANVNVQQKPSRWDKLLQNKPDAYDGYTPLMFVIQAGHSELVPLLLNKGADVNMASEHGNTALMSAVKQGDLALVKLLIKNKADVKAKNKFGSDAIYFATKRVMSEKYEKIIDALKAAGAEE